ncbi:hypothetical protein KEM60_03330 [Austwickia sp. TVS 96-490-7B]|uniref:hypothetical protein n=1 Tax=Austwickia sp. TVS 96-490-7B TaxID=2830843 RepID=UPI001C55CAAE|nr:hypothetical protein [Austwickia sp. TVS 96-490-7B]MBW3087100.1 hypothetical protein [Austwickia sp. TVS 96-490-7B]
MTIGSITAASTQYMKTHPIQRRAAAASGETCTFQGQVFFRKDEEFFAKAYGWKFTWPITESPGPRPMAEVITRFAHQTNYAAGKPFDTLGFIRASSRTYPDDFDLNLLNKAALFFGDTSLREDASISLLA